MLLSATRTPLKSNTRPAFDIEQMFDLAALYQSSHRVYTAAPDARKEGAMDTPQAQELGQAVAAIRPRQIGALPLVYPILDALHVCQTTAAGQQKGS
jgi:hypothetical protein